MKIDFIPSVFRVQKLNPEDYLLRLKFCQWVLQQPVLQPDFTAHILFTDEAVFKRESVFNAHNFHFWATNNPHAYQQRFSVNLWACIVNPLRGKQLRLRNAEFPPESLINSISE